MLLVACISSTPQPALANHIGDPVYRIRFFTDSSKAVQVGEDVGDCRYVGVTYSHTGQATEFSDYQLIGYCNGGYWVELH